MTRAITPLILVLAMGTISFAAEGDDKRPNLLLIIADDACWRDFGFAGNRDVQTPHLNQLAQQGMLLEGMFAPASTCSPVRHALYTGLYSIRSGAYPNHTRVYDGTRSLFTYLKEDGYRVALQNKSHVRPPKSFPYEHVGKNADDFTATRKFITRNAQEPWLLVYASNDPHSPWTRGPQELYDPKKLTVPSYLHDNATTRQLLARYYAEITQLDEQVGRLMTMLDKTQQANDTLVLFVSEQGSSFPYGGKWTLFDNGMRISAIARWPGIITPGSRSSALMQYVDVTPTFLDVAGIDPTQIDTGCPDANGNRGFDGRSFLNVLRGETDTFRDYVYAQNTTVGVNGYLEPFPMRAVRDTRYKLICNLASHNTYKIGGIHKGEPITSWIADAQSDPQLKKRIDGLFHRPAVELYDLKNDPNETDNRADDPELADVRERLQKKLDAWMAQQGDAGLQTELNAPSRQPGRNAQGRKRRNP